MIPFKPDTGTTSAAAASRIREARALKDALEDAGGAFVKLGQILSTRTDILPVEFSHELGTLQQQVPPAPWEQVAEVLATELSRPLEEVFSQIDHEPVAAASLGQVHLAGHRQAGGGQGTASRHHWARAARRRHHPPDRGPDDRIHGLGSAVRCLRPGREPLGKPAGRARLHSEVRSQITDLLIAFSRDDARALADALIAFVPLHDDLDEHALRRQIGDFTSRYLRPGATLDVAAFNQIIAILAANRLSVPPELSVAFRAIAAAEGTLRRLSSQFDFVAESAAYANQRLAAAKQPGVVSRTAVDELAGFLPLARKLPYRIDRISGSLADGRLSVNVRLFADQRDRKVVRELAHFAATAFLAGVFGIMAAMLLTSGQGPQVSATLTLYQVFGYLLVVASGILTLRVLFDVFRRRQRH